MICAVVLAAGLSRRMGTQKLLLPFGGQPVITHILNQLKRSRVDGVVVVAGGDEARIVDALAGLEVSIVRNPDPERGGMLCSVRCGLKALPPECAGVLVALGDQPAIHAGLVDRMIEAFHSYHGIKVRLVDKSVTQRAAKTPQRTAKEDTSTEIGSAVPNESKQRGILVPCHRGRRGHPILFSTRFRDELMSQYDDEGLRGLLRAHPEEIFELEVQDEAVLTDMDTPDDYRRELARLEKSSLQE